MDRTGKFTIKPEYNGAAPFSEGLARVFVEGELGSTGYIDHSGKFAIPPHLSYGSEFNEGLAAVIIDGPCQILNGGDCNRARFRAIKTNAHYDCRFSFIDKTGKTISDLRFDDADGFSEGLAAVRIGEKWGYVDKSGKIAIAPQFESAQRFSEGLAAVEQNKKFGFIDRSGAFVIEPQFISAEPFSDQRALVMEGGRNRSSVCWFIDPAGQRAFPATFTTAASFMHGLAPVSNDLRGGRGTVSYINTSGKTVFSYTLP